MPHQGPSYVRALLACAFVLGASAAPAAKPIPYPEPWAEPQKLQTYNSDPAANPTVNPVGPPQATGSLRGPASLNGYSPSNPVSLEDTVIPTSDFQLAPGQGTDSASDNGLYLDFNGVENPQPLRGSTDAPTDPGPRNYAYDRLNSDILAPPASDQGGIPNAKWPFGLSHNRHGHPATAGWARQQNVEDLPAATAMAGVDFRLSPFAYRELHWHKTNEWAYMIAGSVRLVATNPAGEVFIDDLQAGDVWFFPAGFPHSIQALENGCEFLLVFDDGSFSEDGTSLVTQLFSRTPKEVLAKNFRADVSAFEKVPDVSGGVYIFNGSSINSTNVESQNSTGPGGPVPKRTAYSYHWSQQEPYVVPGGSVKIIDSVNFPVADNFAVALVHVEPGAMREMHWHPTSDEWNYFMAGQARITVYSPPSSSQTFDFSAGDVGYIPTTQAHYIENTGNETVVFLEVLLAPRFTDISVAQWLGLMPKQVVEDHLHLPESVLNNLPKTHPYIIPSDGTFNSTRTNYTGDAE